MTEMIGCTFDRTNCPLWADGLPPEDILEKAFDEDQLRIRDCRLRFDEDDILVIEPLKRRKAKS